MKMLIQSEFDKLTCAFFEVKKRLDQAELEETNFLKSCDKPSRPSLVDSVEEWNSYLELSNQYNKHLEEVQKEKDSALKEYQRAQKDLVNLLPAHVWFRVDDETYIGVATSDWGGNHCFVKIGRVGTEFPCLNERTRD